jgi:hypothetical protein
LTKCRLRTAKGSVASSRPDVLAEAMAVLNEVVAEHLVTDKNKAMIFIGMGEPMKRVG